jgi:hypothetical protein
MSHAKLEDLIGKTMVRVVNEGNEAIAFMTDGGRSYRLFHDQECCERVTVEDVIGDLDDLVGAPICLAEVVSHVNETPPGATVKENEDDGSFTWTFYKFATLKGYVTIRWYGSSNGYYSEEVDFREDVA